MSINIITRCLGGPVYTIRQTVCDDCKVILSEELASPNDHVGTTLLVCDWCKDCTPKHSFPMDQPVTVVRGMSIVNLASIAKVRITTSKPPRDFDAKAEAEEREYIDERKHIVKDET